VCIQKLRIGRPDNNFVYTECEDEPGKYRCCRGFSNGDVDVLYLFKNTEGALSMWLAVAGPADHVPTKDWLFENGQTCFMCRDEDAIRSGWHEWTPCDREGAFMEDNTFWCETEVLMMRPADEGEDHDGIVDLRRSPQRAR
jgi:hypothetical protein